MNRILFVDDEDNILQGIRRLLRPMRNEWHMTFANGGIEALSCLELDLYDAIISDTRMPGMSGIELLNKVKELYPNMVRIGLSGQTEEELSLLSTMSTHQQLTKPCEKEQLVNTIAKAIKQCDQIADESLKSIITSTEALPSLPRLFNEINAAMESSDGSLVLVAELVAQDMAVSAKILQLVNSAFFGIPRHISSPEKAVMLLGYDVVKNLVLNIKLLDQFDEKQVAEFNINEIWDRSLSLSAMAKSLAGLINLDKKDQDYAQIAAMFLDIGMLVMINNKPDQYREVIRLQKETGLNMGIVEKNVFGCTHADVGGALLGIWGLPEEITRAVSFHLVPSKSDDTTPKALTVAHLVNVFYNTNKNRDLQSELDSVYIEMLGIGEEIEGWQEAINNTFFEEQ
jgi:HD-like signal output (HDOD) protein